PGPVGELLCDFRRAGRGPAAGGLRLMLPATFETVGDGKRLRVARLGSGPPLVLLHGYPDNLQIWCELAPRLAARHEVIAFDWPGMARSDAWPGGTTPQHLAERLWTRLDAWRTDRGGLVGMDMGGQPALALAALLPERTRQVVVMNSLVFGEEATSWEISIPRKFGWNRFILRHLPGVGFRRGGRAGPPRGGGPAARPRVPAAGGGWPPASGPRWSRRVAR